MAQARSVSRRAVREKARQRKQQRNSLFIVMGLGILLLIVAGVWLILQNGAQGGPQAEIIYRPEDVVYDQPLHAVHEMEPFDPASIPYLPEGGPQPQIQVSETFHSFGVVGATEVVTKDFVIANTGDAPLTISRAYTTCGCTTADFSGSVIPPGKVSIITLTFDAGYHDARGQTVRRGVIIENNDRQYSQVEIWTQASVSNSS